MSTFISSRVTRLYVLYIFLVFKIQLQCGSSETIKTVGLVPLTTYTDVGEWSEAKA
jgi:hypothetical protein